MPHCSMSAGIAAAGSSDVAEAAVENETKALQSTISCCHGELMRTTPSTGGSVFELT